MKQGCRVAVSLVGGQAHTAMPRLPGIGLFSASESMDSPGGHTGRSVGSFPRQVSPEENVVVLPESLISDTTSMFSVDRVSGSASKETPRSNAMSISTGGGRRRGRRRRQSLRRMDAESDSGSSDGFTDLDWHDMDMAHLPLHMLQNQIPKKQKLHEVEDLGNWQLAVPANASSEPSQTSTTPPGSKDQVAPVDETGGDSDEESEEICKDDDDEEDDSDPGRYAPDLHIRMEWYELALMLCICTTWVVLMVFLLAMVFFRYAQHKTFASDALAEGVLLDSQALVAGVLTPAATMSRAISMGVLSKILDPADPYGANLTLLVSPELAAAPIVQYVQVVGVATRLILLRPGLLHDTTQQYSSQRTPLVYAVNVDCNPQNPLGCLMLDDSNLVESPMDRMQVGWSQPAWLSVDVSGNPLDSSDWIFSHNFLAFAQARGTDMPFAVHVALDLAPLADQLQEHGGGTSPSAYVCTVDGTLLAGTDWTARAVLDQQTGALVYPRLWDIGLDWPLLGAAPDAMYSEGRSTTILEDGSVVMVAPLDVGAKDEAIALAGKKAIRVVVHVPAVAAKSSYLQTLATMGLILAILMGFSACLGLAAVLVQWFLARFDSY